MTGDFNYECAIDEVRSSVLKLDEAKYLTHEEDLT